MVFLSPHLFISFSPVLTLSGHFYVSVYKLLAHPIDLIVSTAMTYLDLGFGLEACAAFYCQNSLTESLNSLKTTESGNPRLEHFPLCPHGYSCKDFHKMYFTFSINSLAAVRAHQMTPETPRTWGKAGVPLPPDNF